METMQIDITVNDVTEALEIGKKIAEMLAQEGWKLGDTGYGFGQRNLEFTREK